MTNDERNPKPECRKTLSGAFAGFVLRILSFLRISSFVIRICEEWFVESHHDFDAAHWDHDPVAIPLTRPSDTLSPSGGEGWGEGAGIDMGSLLSLLRMRRDHEPAASGGTA